MQDKDFTIREAQTSDAEGLLAYIQHLLEEPGVDIPLTPAEFNLSVYEEEMILAEYIVSENSIFLIAEVGGEVVGALSCKGSVPNARRHAVILGISVDREWRNRGIGNALMAKAIDWAKGTGIVKRIELNVYARNEIAIHLYEKYGFEVEGRRRKAISREGRYEDDLIMALVL